jgi:hypothetical protein
MKSSGKRAAVRNALDRNDRDHVPVTRNPLLS